MGPLLGERSGQTGFWALCLPAQTGSSCLSRAMRPGFLWACVWVPWTPGWGRVCVSFPDHQDVSSSRTTTFSPRWLLVTASDSGCDIWEAEPQGPQRRQRPARQGAPRPGMERDQDPGTTASSLSLLPCRARDSQCSGFATGRPAFNPTWAVDGPGHLGRVNLPFCASASSSVKWADEVGVRQAALRVARTVPVQPLLFPGTQGPLPAARPPTRPLPVPHLWLPPQPRGPPPCRPL